MRIERDTSGAREHDDGEEDASQLAVYLKVRGEVAERRKAAVC